MTKSIGIDIGGTNFRVGVFEATTLLSETRFEANFSQIFKNEPAEQAVQSIVKCIADSIESVMAQHADIEYIGIGFPGFIDPHTKCISESPNLPGLKNIYLDKALSEQLTPDISTTHIHLENDALAAAYGEYAIMQSETPSLIYFGLGTGVGGGLIICGTPFSGFHGMAMEVGHIIVKPNGRLCGCGNRGCVEQYASATGIQKTYSEATQQTLQAHEIASLASQGDASAQQAFVIAGESLAIAVAHVLKTVDVPTVVIGGGLSQSWKLMEKSFHQTLDANLIPVLRGKVNIKISGLNDTAGMLGAAQLAMRPKH